MTYGTAMWVALPVLVFAITTIIFVCVQLLLRRGLYHRIKPESRPRRWAVFSFLILLVSFAVWFPIWILWQHSLLARILLVIFTVVFGLVVLGYRNFARLIDSAVEKKGWPLR